MRRQAVSDNSGSLNVLSADLTFIAYVLLLLPFFEPMCLQYLTGTFVSSIELLFTGSRIAISLIILVLVNTKIIKNNTFLIFAFLFMGISILINSDLSVTFRRFVSLFGYFGFLALFPYLLDKNPRATLNALIFIFIINYIFSLYTVFMLPHGMTSSFDDGYIYYFGGKNSVFLWFMPLIILILAIRQLKGKNTISWFSITLLGLSCCTAVVVDSASSIFMFGLSVLVLVILKINPSNNLLRKALNPKLLFIIVTIVFSIVVLADSANTFSFFLNLMDTSTTLTGRDVVWAQAIDNIIENPIFGVGPMAYYVLANGVITSHPHSFFLQYAASYGVPFIILFLADIVAIIRKLNSRTMSLSTLSIAFLFFILLLHSCFDIMLLYTYLLVRGLLMYSAEFDRGNYKKAQLGLASRFN